MSDILDMSIDEFDPESQHDYGRLSAPGGPLHGKSKEYIYQYYKGLIADEREQEELDEIIGQEDAEEDAEIGRD
jgi:hypothetical protein